MSKNKNLKPPKWMVKIFDHGKELEDINFIRCSIIVYFPLEVINIFRLKIDFIYSIILVFLALGLSYYLYIWLRNKIIFLENCRKSAIEKYKNAKTFTEKKEASLEMKELRIPDSNTKKT